LHPVADAVTESVPSLADAVNYLTAISMLTETFEPDAADELL
jgi:hypothetical protein